MRALLVSRWCLLAGDLEGFAAPPSNVPGQFAPTSIRRAQSRETEEKRQKDRERQRHHRAHLSPEKKAAVRQRQRESRKIRKMQKEEKLAALQEKARQFTVKAKFLAAKNAEMKENVKEYEALLAEEPMVNDDDAGNVRDSFAYARSKPALFEVLTGETNESFDELFELLKVSALPQASLAPGTSTSCTSASSSSVSTLHTPC